MSDFVIPVDKLALCNVLDKSVDKRSGNILLLIGMCFTLHKVTLEVV